MKQNNISVVVHFIAKTKSYSVPMLLLLFQGCQSDLQIINSNSFSIGIPPSSTLFPNECYLPQVRHLAYECQEPEPWCFHDSAVPDHRWPTFWWHFWGECFVQFLILLQFLQPYEQWPPLSNELGATPAFQFSVQHLAMRIKPGLFSAAVSGLPH